MKYLKFLITGIIFGIIMTKAEIISWFRIYEMFRFESFHMYGVIGSTVVIGAIMVFLMKHFRMKNIQGSEIHFTPKNKSTVRYLTGGTIFGLGWALSGACPGPMFVLIGYGYLPILIVIASAIFGTFVYGIIKDKLPH